MDQKGKGKVIRLLLTGCAKHNGRAFAMIWGCLLLLALAGGPAWAQTPQATKPEDNIFDLGEVVVFDGIAENNSHGPHCGTKMVSHKCRPMGRCFAGRLVALSDVAKP